MKNLALLFIALTPFASIAAPVNGNILSAVQGTYSGYLVGPATRGEMQLSPDAQGTLRLVTGFDMAFNSCGSQIGKLITMDYKPASAWNMWQDTFEATFEFSPGACEGSVKGRAISLQIPNPLSASPRAYIYLYIDSRFDRQGHSQPTMHEAQFRKQ